MKLTLPHLSVATVSQSLRQPSRCVWLILFVAMLLNGCAAVDTDERPPQGQEITQPGGNSLQRQVDALRGANDFAGAAQLWLQQAALPDIDPLQRDGLLLNAVDDLLTAELTEQAQTTLMEVSVTTSPRWVLSSARLQQQLNRPANMLALLETLTPTGLDSAQRQDFLSLQADALSRLGQYLPAVEALNQLDTLATDPQQRNANHALLWSALNQLPEPTLTNAYNQSEPGPLRGWLELALLNLQARNIGGSVQIDTWRNRYPSHPASADFLQTLRGIIAVPTRHPQKIALLLPLSGRIAEPARAVRDGFLAAYYADQGHNGSTSVQVYAVTDDNVDSVYQQAVQDGADFVVGPLDKDAVRKIAERPTLPVPTLALNAVSQQQDNAQLYQFALLPEDEARQVAERIWLDGYSKGAIIFPDTNWGQRVRTAFQEHWTTLGGKLVAEQVYSLSNRDFSAPVKQMLNVDASKSRFRNIRRMLGGKIEFVARRRQDVEFIFIAAYPQQARQIRPQLKFFNAGRLPVYATSHVYSGVSEPSRDRDMNGIIFGDMPWTLQLSKDQSLHTDISNLWQNRSRKLSRLYAFGIDAYNVIPHLPRLRQYPFERFSGNTGSLRVDAHQQLHRQLRWAQFLSGKPKPVKLENTTLLDTAPETPAVPLTPALSDPADVIISPPSAPIP